MILAVFSGAAPHSHAWAEALDARSQPGLGGGAAGPQRNQTFCRCGAERIVGREVTGGGGCGRGVAGAGVREE